MIILFISALKKTHFDELKDNLYDEIKKLHEKRYLIIIFYIKKMIDVQATL